MKRLERRLARAQRGSNRRARVKLAIARLRAREIDRRKDWAEKAPGRVGKVRPAFTSQRCSACGQVDPKSRESQAVFRCTACGYACNADVNAARNIAAGHAVTARGGDGVTRPVNREPHLLASLTGLG
jgi:transposase